MTQAYIPKPFFDTLTEIIALYKDIQSAEQTFKPISNWLTFCLNESTYPVPEYAKQDYYLALRFLYSYRGSKDTFSSYRRELERLLQWSWFINNKSIFELKREDIEEFVAFCIKPPKQWISIKKSTRFKVIAGNKVINPTWRPFEARLSKVEIKQGKTPKKADYQFSQSALKVLFAILSSFYNFLLQEDAVQTNPVSLIRQKSKFLRKEASNTVIRRLSDRQFQTVLSLAKDRADLEPKYERDLFILSCFFAMYLRISELVSNERWTPLMSHFFKDTSNNWWFKVVGKGNKARQIAVSDQMLNALKRYRFKYLGLTPLPLPGEHTPLIGHIKNPNLAISSDFPIRKLVQSYFDLAAEKMLEKGDEMGASILKTATVHWLRHTGISEDVKHRPREHVRDDAGHSSSAITDRYIDVELHERANSARHKKIIKEEK